MSDVPPLLTLDELQRLTAQLDQAMVRDRHMLRRDADRLRGLLRGDRLSEAEPLWHKWLDRWQHSREQFDQRLSSLPAFEAWPDLPIVERREEIQAALRDHPVIVVCGETGSGKSTQLPKFCLEMGRGISGMIGHTQPRRLAARSIGTRLASELGVSLGQQVGYQVRFQDATGPQTLVKLMTDGILLAETQQDRFLERYDTIIVDEAHERSLNVDFLLGYLTQLLTKRRDLRLIVTSATIDAQRFAAHFQAQLGTDALPPVIEVSGRSYPVELRYRPAPGTPGGREADAGETAADYVGDLVEELLLEGPGDLLVFLPTERHIRELAKLLRGRPAVRQASAEVLPLYARLPTNEQQAVFTVGRRRRIVLATNVAESSLTVPGIRYVIDTGTARISRYSPRSKVQRLPIEAISRASADQRKGRCGRVGPGICVRTYAEEDYLSRSEFTDPEIRRTHLAGVILRMLALQLGEIDRFPLIDPPRPESVRDGYRTLTELRAVDEHRRLTELGRKLSRLPVDPRIARMIVAAEDEQCLPEMLILAAVLEIQDPRERPVDRQADADTAHAQFADSRSDFMSLLNLWDFYHRLRDELSRSKLRLACRQNFLSLQRLQEWSDLHLQLRQLVHEAGWRIGPRRNQPDSIHRALLAGLLSNVAMKGDTNEYQGSGGSKCYLWPGSTLFNQRPLWVMGAEQIETTRRYLRTVAAIQPEWIEKQAEHLIRRSYTDPFWSRANGTVLAYERVTLFGLPIVPRRRRPYGHVDPAAARRLFIEHALVEGDFDSRQKFFQANRRLVAELEKQAARTRRNDLIIGAGVQVAFYEQRLPSDVFDAPSLDRWIKTEPQRDATLRMEPADLLGGLDWNPNPHAYPDFFRAGALELPLEYAYEPGEPHDGLTVVVPAAALAQLTTDQLDWGVPGMLADKLLALIRSLPKQFRRQLIPANEVAGRAATELKFGHGGLLPAAAEYLSQLSGERFTASAFQLDRLPDHLRTNVKVVDDQGKLLAQNRDLDELQRQFGASRSLAPQQTAGFDWQRAGITAWDWGELPQRIDVRRAGVVVPMYPALQDRGDSIAQIVLSTSQDATWETNRALLRLFQLTHRKIVKTQVDWLPGLNQWGVVLSTAGVTTDLRADLGDLLVARAWEHVSGIPRSAEEFAGLALVIRQLLPEVVQEVTPVLTRLFAALHQAQLSLAGVTNPGGRHQSAIEDMRRQLGDLTSDRFLAQVPWKWLQHYPRYLQGISVRCEKLAAGGAAKDAQGLSVVAPYAERLRTALTQLPTHVSQQDPWLELRWMLEELRVSLFAQQLGTAHKASPQRLDKLWQAANSQMSGASA